MKTRLLLIAALAIIVQLQSSAAISVDQTTNPQYLKNTGYSDALSSDVSVVKARGLGQEYYTQDEVTYKNMTPVAKFLRKFYVYTDPAAEDYSFTHHDTTTVPKYTDF